MNKLETATLTLAVGQTYTLKDDEVAINNNLYKKVDVEISMAGTLGTNDEKDVSIGIRSRGNRKITPATMLSFDKWQINGTTPNSLSELVEQINTAIK